MREQIIEADLTWTGERFEAGIRIAVSAAGRIAAVGPGGPEPTRRMRNRALLPGFVNVHSHAFQVGLRGRGEAYPEGSGDFWSWRRAMYDLVGAIDPDRFHRLSLRAFHEMRAAGITTVGEFHYLHHSDGGADFALDESILTAARKAGIRLVLLQVYYRTAGIGRPVEAAQERFLTVDPDTYWKQVDRLGTLLDPALQSLGAVAHSIRAVPLDEIVALHQEARRRRLPFHMHVEEQPREIEECRAAHGATPMQLLNDRLAIDPSFTAVHCTHTAGEEMDRFLAAGGNVCICPLTEASLGDGIPDLARIRTARGRIGLGTDCNARISMLEEMRWLEYGQRLGLQGRGVLRDRSGSIAAPLLRAATADGARCLDLPAGAIEAGRWADFAAVDLGSPLLADVGPDVLPEALLFGASHEGVIAATCVGGEWAEAEPHKP